MNMFLNKTPNSTSRQNPNIPVQFVASLSAIDAVLVRYLKLGVQDSHIILMATQDEASFK